ncbi:MAG: hypothetical protein ACYS8W_02760 [Planctomycetota bacterium]
MKRLDFDKVKEDRILEVCPGILLVDIILVLLLGTAFGAIFLPIAYETYEGNYSTLKIAVVFLCFLPAMLFVITAAVAIFFFRIREKWTIRLTAESMTYRTFLAAVSLPWKDVLAFNYFKSRIVIDSSAISRRKRILMWPFARRSHTKDILLVFTWLYHNVDREDFLDAVDYFKALDSASDTDKM